MSLQRSVMTFVLVLMFVLPTFAHCQSVRSEGVEVRTPTPQDVDRQKQLKEFINLGQFKTKMAHYPIDPKDPDFKLFNAEETNWEVNVCFVGKSVLPPQMPFTYIGDDPTVRRIVRFAIDGTWGAVSGLQFTGYGECSNPAPPNSVPILIVRCTGAGCAGGLGRPGVGRRISGEGWFPDDIAQIQLGVPDNNMLANTVVHEMGHVLGLAHEHQRIGAVRCQEHTHTSTPCATSNDCPQELQKQGCDVYVYSGQPDRPGLCIAAYDITEPGLKGLTPYDPQSIMNYCRTDTSEKLTSWDVFGIQWLYWTRTSAFNQLVTAYSLQRTEHATVASPGQSLFDILRPINNNDYGLAYAEGWVYEFQAPNTVPLDLYYHDTRKDYMLVATDESRNAAIGAGYRLVKTEGYAYASQQPGTIPLKLLWSADRQDNFTTTTKEGMHNAAVAGYSTVRTEAYIFADVPYDVLWTYWHPGRGDNLMTAQNSALATAAVEAGYESSGRDGVILKYHLPGTAALKQYWSGTRQDHFATATDRGTGDAIDAGYSLIGKEGYVFSKGHNHTGTRWLELWWSSERGDNLTTADRLKKKAATDAGYIQGELQGFIYEAPDVTH